MKSAFQHHFKKILFKDAFQNISCIQDARRSKIQVTISSSVTNKVLIPYTSIVILIVADQINSRMDPTFTCFMMILNTNRLTSPANETEKTERNSTIKIPLVSETAGAKQHFHHS